MIEPADPKPARGGAYEYRGPVQLAYAPTPDREPDPGEIVWTWVPYEENPDVGKDRPLLVIGHADRPDHYAALMLSTKDHRGDHGWVSLGSGAWDSDRRESWVRFDRVFAVADGSVRREGAVLRPDAFLLLLDKVRRESQGEQVD